METTINENVLSCKCRLAQTASIHMILYHVRVGVLNEQLSCAFHTHSYKDGDMNDQSSSQSRAVLISRCSGWVNLITRLEV